VTLVCYAGLLALPSGSPRVGTGSRRTGTGGAGERVAVAGSGEPIAGAVPLGYMPPRRLGYFAHLGQVSTLPFLSG
jgi:hypothetical protein